MSVAKRIIEAVNKMEASDYEGALYQLCSAIGATADKEYGKRGRSSYKQFIRDNMTLITDVAFNGLKIEKINIAYEHPEINSDEVTSLEDILYHVIRNGFYHEAEMPEDIHFNDEQQIRIVKGKEIFLPKSLIYGLISAVVVSPCNSSQSTEKIIAFNIGKFQIPISKLWGNKRELMWLLDASNEMTRLIKK